MVSAQRDGLKWSVRCLERAVLESGMVSGESEMGSARVWNGQCSGLKGAVSGYEIGSARVWNGQCSSLERAALGFEMSSAPVYNGQCSGL